MRLSRYLTEKYFGRIESEEVFVNPTSSDIKELKKAGSSVIRFLADPAKKNVFAWPGRLIHADVMGDLDIKHLGWTTQNVVHYITGTADIVGGKLVMTDSDEIDTRLEDIVRDRGYDKSKEMINSWRWIWEGDIKWVSRYVDMKDWLKRSGKIFKKIKADLE